MTDKNEIELLKARVQELEQKLESACLCHKPLVKETDARVVRIETKHASYMHHEQRAPGRDDLGERLRRHERQVPITGPDADKLCCIGAYEGNKVMVFLNVTEADALRWRRIDPHFRDPKAARAKTEAPPPDARFPGNHEGWEDAVSYAQGKKGSIR